MFGYVDYYIQLCSCFAGISFFCSEDVQAWYVLTVTVVHAEFPEWEAMQAFGIFNLSEQDTITSTTVSDTWREEAIRRLAQIFGQMPEKLRAQIHDHFPLAQRMHVEQQCNTFQAWKLALDRTQSRTSTYACHPADALLPVLLGGSLVQELFEYSI